MTSELASLLFVWVLLNQAASADGAGRRRSRCWGGFHDARPRASKTPRNAPIAAGMAGATRIGPGRYMLIATTSAVAWALAWMSAGYALGHVTGRMPTAFGFLTTLGFLAGAILAVCLAVCLVVRHRRRGRGTGGHRAGRPAR